MSVENKSTTENEKEIIETGVKQDKWTIPKKYIQSHLEITWGKD